MKRMLPEIECALNSATLALLHRRPRPPGEAWFELRRRILNLPQNRASPTPVLENIGFNRSSSIPKYDNVFVTELVKAHRRPVNVYPAELTARARQVNARAGQAIAKREGYWANRKRDWTNERNWTKAEEDWAATGRIWAIGEEIFAAARRVRGLMAKVKQGVNSRQDMKMIEDEFRRGKERAATAKVLASERGWAEAEQQ